MQKCNENKCFEGEQRFDGFSQQRHLKNAKNALNAVRKMARELTRCSLWMPDQGCIKEEGLGRAVLWKDYRMQGCVSFRKKERLEAIDQLRKIIYILQAQQGSTQLKVQVICTTYFPIGTKQCLISFLQCIVLCFVSVTVVE